jgi:hypothetical protein
LGENGIKKIYHTAPDFLPHAPPDLTTKYLLSNNIFRPKLVQYRDNIYI